MTGVMEVVETSVSKPARFISALKNPALPRNLSTSSVELSNISIDAMQAACTSEVCGQRQ
ncbi:MAG: hypothetical protein WBV22_06325 [Anaerolineaceae bacterium]